MSGSLSNDDNLKKNPKNHKKKKHQTKKNKLKKNKTGEHLGGHEEEAKGVAYTRGVFGWVP